MLTLTLLACVPGDPALFDLVLTWDPHQDILTLEVDGDGSHHADEPLDIQKADCTRLGDSRPQVAGLELQKEQEVAGPDDLVQKGALTSFTVPFAVWPPERLSSLVVGGQVIGNPIDCPGRNCSVI